VEAPAAPSKVPTWLAKAAPVLGGLAILLLGMGLGAAWERLMIHELLPVISNVAVPFLSGVGAVLVPLIVGVFVLKRVYSQRVASKEAAEAKELVGQELERALSVWVYRKSEPDWEAGRAERLKRLRELAMAAGKVGMAALGLRSAVSLLAVVLGGTLAFASLIASYLQIERLGEQNGLIRLQTRLTLQDQESQVLRSQADAAYEQIAGILLNMDSTEQAQIFALKQIPEAMRLAVPRERPTGSGGVETVVDFPNLERLRGVLRAFMRQDRAMHALRRAGVVKQGLQTSSVPWGDFVREVFAQGEVSDTLIEVLHRLGPAEAAHPKASLWAVTPAPETSTLPQPRPPPVEVASSEIPNREGRPRTVLIYELSHIDPSEFPGLQLPFLFSNVFRTGERQVGKYQVRFPAKVALNGARLDGAKLPGVDLTDAKMLGVSLRNAILVDSSLVRATLAAADVRGAILSGAKLHALQAEGAWFQGAVLRDAQLWGARLTSARFEAAILNSAQLNGAELQNVRMNGALLNFAQLLGANLRSADLTGILAQGADFSKAALLQMSLVGADLSMARFHGAYMDSADLRGANLSRAQFQAMELQLKSLEVNDHKGHPVSVLASEGTIVSVGPAELVSAIANSEAKVGRGEIWRVPSFEKSAVRWVTEIWDTEEVIVGRLGWAQGEPDALPADFEQVVVPRLRRELPGPDTNLAGANFEGVKLGPAWRAALAARASALNRGP
jgi:uncharacterized protein YjbI with pentapeptide repeats